MTARGPRGGSPVGDGTWSCHKIQEASGRHDSVGMRQDKYIDYTRPLRGRETGVGRALSRAGRDSDMRSGMLRPDREYVSIKDLLGTKSFSEAILKFLGNTRVGTVGPRRGIRIFLLLYFLPPFFLFLFFLLLPVSPAI